VSTTIRPYCLIMTRRRNPQMTASTIPVQNKTMAEIAAEHGCPEVAVNPVGAADGGEEDITVTQRIPVETLADLLTRSDDSGQ
jgi:hypothetical protein